MDVIFSDRKTKHGYPCDIVISALQKYIRRGETEKAAHCAYELYLTDGELTEYVWRRILVISVEDICMGEPYAPVLMETLYRISRDFRYDDVDYPLFFVHAIRYLCMCKKERGSCNLKSVIKRRIQRGAPPELPDTAWDMHTKQGQLMGRNMLDFLTEGAQVIPEVDVDGNTWREELYRLVQEELAAAAEGEKHA